MASWAVSLVIMSDEVLDLGNDRALEIEDAKLKPDRFGFIIMDNFHRSLPLSDEVVRLRAAIEEERSVKWNQMIGNWAFMTNFRMGKVVSRVKKGIPDSARPFAWYRLSNGPEVKRSLGPYTAISTSKLTEFIVEEVN